MLSKCDDFRAFESNVCSETFWAKFVLALRHVSVIVILLTIVFNAQLPEIMLETVNQEQENVRKPRMSQFP